ncbi:MAG: sugar phosphate nucleotidyltransferase [Patescibacteria group bacterium]
MSLTQAILPVAGLGTRFLPWTKAVPKEMLPVGRLPIIALLVDECISVGIREICFVISRGKEVIPQFFAQDAKLEEELRKRGKSEVLNELLRYDSVKFTSVYQEEQHGDGHALLSAVDFVKSDNVAVLFGDDLIVGKENGLQQLAKQMSEIRDQGSGSDCAFLCLQDVPREQISRYGIASVEETERRLKRITGLVEKPAPEKAPSTLAIVGKYIIPRSLFGTLEKIGGGPTSLPSGELRRAKEIRIIDALIASLPTLPVYGYVFEGKRYDTGTPEGYRETVLALG